MIYAYVDLDGRIARTHTTHRPIETMKPMNGHYVVELDRPADLRRHYYSGGIMERQEMSLDYPVEGIVGAVIEISGIPEGTLVRWPDGYESFESGSIEFDTNAIGPHKFLFENVAYLSKQVTINVA